MNFKPGDVVRNRDWVGVVGDHDTGRPEKKVPLAGWCYDAHPRMWHVYKQGGCNECILVTDKKEAERIVADFVRAQLVGDVIGDMSC